MKKILACVFTALLLLSALALSSSAAGIALSADRTTASPDSVIRFTLSVSALPASTSASVVLSYDDSFFEYADGGWLAGTNPVSVDAGENGGQIVVGEENALEGELTAYFFTLRIKADTYGRSTVTVAFSAAGEDTFSASRSVEIASYCGDHQFNGWKQTKEPGCTQAGEESNVCGVCGYTETRPVAALDHDWSLWSVVTPSTCTGEGLQERHCSRCEASETRPSPADGHKVQEYAVTKEPTCTEPGEKSGECTVCHATVTESVPARGHAWGNWTTTKEPTCTEEGEQTRACTRCPERLTRPAAALGHDFEDPQVVREATLSHTGLVQGKCRRCGETTDQILPCRAEDAATGIRVDAEEGVFAEGAVFSVSALPESGEAHDAVKTALADLSATFAAFDLAARLDGTDVQPSAPVTLTFPVPQGYNAAETRLYEIAESGVAKRLEAELSDDEKTLAVEVSALGRFALADLSAGTEAPPEPTRPEPSTSANPPASTRKPTPVRTEEGVDTDSLAAVFVVIGLAVVAVVAAILVRPKKKKKK